MLVVTSTEHYTNSYWTGLNHKQQTVLVIRFLFFIFSSYTLLDNLLTQYDIDLSIDIFPNYLTTICED